MKNNKEPEQMIDDDEICPMCDETPGNGCRSCAEYQINRGEYYKELEAEIKLKEEI